MSAADAGRKLEVLWTPIQQGPAIPASASWNRAVEAGTRTLTGTPGARAWRNTVSYQIEAEVDPETAILRGHEVITYRNASPGALTNIVLNLYQNIFSEGVPRNRFAPVTGGVQLRSITVNGAPVRYSTQGTLAFLLLPAPLASGNSAVLEIEWEHTIPPATAFRTAWEDALGARVFQVGQWYPQVAMFDDLHGWDATPYLGDGEFYSPFADFDVSITVPTGQLVGATGVLTNPDEVLTEEALTRLESVVNNNGITRIVTDADITAENTTQRPLSGSLTWRFTAEDVRDFAFATSAGYVWDATVTRVPDGVGGTRPVMVHSLYRTGARNWEHAAGFGRDALAFFSEALVPYPSGILTVAEGPISGMEYPAMVFINRPSEDDALYAVIAHETAHQWFPMMVGSDEASFAWLDEGFATYFENLSVGKRYGVRDPFALERASYLSVAGTEREVPLMRHTDLVSPYGDRYVAAYGKPSLLLQSLERVTGPELFHATLAEFLRNWTLRSPTPWDFFAAFETATGRDLGWLFGPWWFETGVLDLAITGVEGAESGRAVVTIGKLGENPAPATLRATTSSGTETAVEIGVERWFSGSREIEVVVEASSPIVRLELEVPLPDMTPQNGVWTADR
ncbi:MAG: M1 family metallopeptidase [Gemmatimonadota bacterium]|jgi:hypothetical protein|nr:M1 family metallopeptidase [Gemmatimonadota bacterium]